MIRINLLPTRISAKADKGKRSLLVAIATILILGLATYLFLHQPAATELAKLETLNEQLSKDIAAKKKRLEGDPKNLSYSALKAALAAEDSREKQIERLEAARVVPAHALRELGRILTPDKTPTMLNPNNARAFSSRWQPKDVWLIEFAETAGRFTVKAGAQSKHAATEFARRMSQSVHFDGIAMPEKSEKSERGVVFFSFVIQGRVIY